MSDKMTIEERGIKVHRHPKIIRKSGPDPRLAEIDRRGTHKLGCRGYDCDC